MYHSCPEEVQRVYHKLTEASLCNSYGLFRRMTGVGGRPEVIIEGSNDLKEGWKEYEFLYKPGDLYRPMSFIGMCMMGLRSSDMHGGGVCLTCCTLSLMSLDRQ